MGLINVLESPRACRKVMEFATPDFDNLSLPLSGIFEIASALFFEIFVARSS